MAKTSNKRKRAKPKNRQGRKSGTAAGRGQPNTGSRRSSPAKRRRRLRTAAFSVVAIAFIALLWWVAGAQHRDFLTLADGGSTAMQEAVTHQPSEGRSHVSGTINYDHRFPTSGPHNPTWADPGVYDQRQPTEKLVHALEHGNVVIYYDEPGKDVLTRLRDWAGTYDNRWSGIVVTPAPGLGESIVLAAWTKRLRLESFEPEVAAAFIDAYRGRGPENPVR